MFSTDVKERSRNDALHADLLRRLQRNSFNYFVHEVNRGNGLVLDKTAPDWPAVFSGGWLDA